MFGYIVVNKPEMKFREFDVYHAFYCGLCRALQRQYGIAGELTLTYDMTFVALLLTGVYEPETVFEMKRCAVHPIHKHQMASNPFLEYAADMNILLFYEKCRDDWNDEKKWTRKAMTGLLKNAYQKVTEKYPKKTEKILSCLNQIYQAEKKKYFVVRERAVPEVLLKVVEAKRLLDSGRVLTVQEAAEQTGISRSSFYKYKDDIFPFHEDAKGKTITFIIQMDD